MQSVKPPQLTKNPKLLRYSLAILILILVAGGIWLAVNKSNNKSSTNNSANASASSSSNFTSYSNSQYGIAFNYPKAWGSPTITAASNSPAQSGGTVKQTGKTYSVKFSGLGGKANKIASIELDSKDYSVTNCSGSQNCTTTYGNTAAAIKSQLSDSKYLWNHSADSFSTLVYGGGAGTLNIYQIVNLPKISVDAAILSYTLINASKSCANNHLYSGSGTNCISQTDYSNLAAVAKSLKAI